jgi:hypothetical protein
LDGYDYGPYGNSSLFLTIWARAWGSQGDRPHVKIAPVEGSISKLTAAIDPRRPIYRDAFNEIFVLVLSATGAAVVIPVLLLIIGALTSKLSLGLFVAISAAAELFLIFGLGRPQMKPHERVGWALLWGFGAAALGAAFWALVYDPVL